MAMDLGVANLDVNYDEVPNLSPLERELLNEYQKLAKSLASLSSKITKLSSAPCSEILTSLQTLESKSTLVYTLLQASVYNVFLQNEDLIEDNDYADVTDY